MNLNEAYMRGYRSVWSKTAQEDTDVSSDFGGDGGGAQSGGIGDISVNVPSLDSLQGEEGDDPFDMGDFKTVAPPSPEKPEDITLPESKFVNSGTTVG